MLLRKHRIIVRSQLHAPRAKPYKTIRIPPPRMLCTKWFFQKDFADQTLFLLYAATGDFSRMWMSYEEQNPQIGFISLNPNMFPNPKWGFAPNTYTIFEHFSDSITGYKLGGGTTSQPQAKDMWTNENGLFSRKYLQPTGSTYSPLYKPPYKSDSGEIPWDSLEEKNRYATWPVRYNPFFDKGDGNIVTSIILGASSWNPTCDNCTVRNLPLWLALHGYFDWMVKAVIKTGYEVTYTLAIFSPYTQPANTWLIPVDTGFYYQTYPFNVQVNSYDKQHWFPTIKWQKQTMNDIVRSGPFMPRYTTKAGWDFHFTYLIFFLSGEELFCQDKIFKTQTTKKHSPFPVTSLVEYKSRTRGTKVKRPCFTPGTLDEEYLARELLKESLKTQSLEKICLQGLYTSESQKDQKCKQSRNIWTPQAALQPKSKSHKKKLHQKKKRRRKQSSSSSETSESSSSSSESSS